MRETEGEKRWRDGGSGMGWEEGRRTKERGGEGKMGERERERGREGERKRERDSYLGESGRYNMNELEKD